MKRKAFSVLICAALMTTLCACGNKSGSTPEISEPSIEGNRVNPIAENKFETEDVTGGVKITSCTGNSPEVIIPETIDGKRVVSIRGMMFATSVAITKLYIPSGVVEVNDFMGAFYIYSDAFAEIEVAADNPAFYSRDGVLYSKDNELLCYPNGKADESFTIPDGTSAIGTYAFGNAKNLKSVTIPESVTELKKGAFNNCENLDSANIPSGVTELTHYVFGGCGRLSKLVIPENIADISGLAFAYSDWVDEHADENGLVIVNGVLIDGSNAKGDVTIPETVKRIAAYPFSCNDELKSITIPASVTEISIMAFWDCDTLERVVLPDEQDFDVEELFYGLEGLIVEYRGETITIKE